MQQQSAIDYHSAGAPTGSTGNKLALSAKHFDLGSGAKDSTKGRGSGKEMNDHGSGAKSSGGKSAYASNSGGVKYNKCGSQKRKNKRVLARKEQRQR